LTEAEIEKIKKERKALPRIRRPKKKSKKKPGQKKAPEPAPARKPSSISELEKLESELSHIEGKLNNL
jgi:hypothetical protein